MDHPSGRKLDTSTGLVSLTDAQQAYLEWLTGGRPEGDTHAAFAERIGYSESSLYRWKKDKSFLQMWQERMVATHSRPDTLSDQLENLARIARGSGPEAIRAIELYWKLVDKMTPTKVELTGSEAVAGLSDEELAAALAQAAGAAAERARPESPQEQAERVRSDLGLRAV